MGDDQALHAGSRGRYPPPRRPFGAVLSLGSFIGMPPAECDVGHRSQVFEPRISSGYLRSEPFGGFGYARTQLELRHLGCTAALPKPSSPPPKPRPA